jgi:hypothetical protein
MNFAKANFDYINQFSFNVKVSLLKESYIQLSEYANIFFQIVFHSKVVTLTIIVHKIFRILVVFSVKIP